MHVLICGQVRDEDMFRAAIARFQGFRADETIGRIVLSTWVGEIDGYEGLRAYLTASAVEIVETTAPLHHMESMGNYFYQMTQFINGLEQFEPGDFIFKSRCDIRANFALDFRACKHFWEQSDRERPVVGGLLRHRIAIGLFGAYFPFWCEDRYFYGACADLRAMARLSRSGDILWNPQTAIAEVRFFGGLFIETFPVVRHIMRIFWYLRAFPHDPAVFQSDVVYRAIAIYHHIVDTFFTAGLEPHCVDYAAFEGSIQPPPFTTAPIDDAITAAYRAQPAYIETRAILSAEGTSYLARPEVTSWFRTAVDQLGRETNHIYAGFVEPPAA